MSLTNIVCPLFLFECSLIPSFTILTLLYALLFQLIALMMSWMWLRLFFYFRFYLLCLVGLPALAPMYLSYLVLVLFPLSFLLVFCQRDFTTNRPFLLFLHVC